MLAASLLLLFGRVPVASAVVIPVTSCGQVLSGLGALTADLDCSGHSGPGLTLGDHSSLDLGPFTLSGGPGDGIVCEGYCVVRSSDRETGGTISGFGGHGVVGRNPVEPKSQVRVTNLTVSGNGGDGVVVEDAEGTVTVGRSRILGNGGRGVVSPQSMRVSRSVVSGNAAEGILGQRINVAGSTVELNAVGIDASPYLNVNHSDVVDNMGDGMRIGASLRVFVVHVERNGASGIVFSAITGDAHIQFAEISDNALDGVRIEGPQTERLRMQLAFIRRNGRNGIHANHLLFSQSRIDDNAFHGIYSPPGGPPCRIGIDMYSLVGNGSDPSCGVSVTCADIASCAPPLNMSDATICGRSYDTSSGFPGTSWSICDDD